MQSPENILRHIEWTVMRRLDGLLQGDYRTLFHGFGLEISDLREYQPSDDVRFIDWNVTARMQTPYVRQSHEDRDISVWFLLDISPSVDFGRKGALKRNVLIDFVTLLTRLFTRHGNRVGAIFFSGVVERIIPARSGRSHVLHLIDDLLRQPQLKQAQPTDLTVLLETALRVIRRRSLVFIVSDFISRPGWEKAMQMLAKRHEVLAVRLYDPHETELPDIGITTFEDAETGEQIFIDTHDGGFRRRFHEAVLRKEYELGTVLARTGADLITLSTSDDMVGEILRFTRLRKQQTKTPAVFSGQRCKGRLSR